MRASNSGRFPRVPVGFLLFALGIGSACSPDDGPDPTEDHGPRGLQGFHHEHGGAVQERLAAALLQIEQMKADHQQQVAALKQSLNSANAIVEKSKSFQNQISELQTVNSRLTQQNELFKDRFSQESFLAGAAAIIVGILIGVIFGRISKRKRSGWN